MKKLLLFPLFILAISILAPSCTKDDNEVFPPDNDSIVNNDTLGTNGSISGDTISGDTISGDTISGDTVQNVPIILKYEGDIIVNGNDVRENSVCGANMNSNKLTLYFDSVNFSDRMPKMDIAVPEIHFNSKTGTFAGDTIVPLMAGKIPMPGYTFTQIAGEIEDTILSFNAEIINLGTISFSGKFIGR